MQETDTLAMATLYELLDINSPSGEESEIRDYIINRLRTIGASVKTDESGNIIAKVGASENQCEPGSLMFNAHMDTVALASNVHPSVKERLLVTDGTSALGADDKAGIAAILSALQHVVEHALPHPAITLIFTVREEEGLAGARLLQPQSLPAIKMGFTLDASGPVGTIITKAPSKRRITATFHGTAAHAGFNPEAGNSAISMACRAVDLMKQGRIDSETTANVGTIHGGVATNVVSDTATVVMEARSLSSKKADQQAEHMASCCNIGARAFGGTVDVDIEQLYEQYHLDQDSPLLPKFRTACFHLGIPCHETDTTGGSDANIFNALGIPTAVLCCGYSAAHSIRESLDLDDFSKLLWLVVLLMTARGAA